MISFMSFKSSRMHNSIYKLSSEGKFFLSLIRKTCRTCTFLNHVREEKEQQLMLSISIESNLFLFFFIKNFFDMPHCSEMFLNKIQKEACRNLASVSQFMHFRNELEQANKNEKMLCEAKASTKRAALIGPGTRLFKTKLKKHFKRNKQT